MTLGATGGLEITGSSYKTNPTGLRLGQYTSTIGYIQAPAGGRIAMWNDGTGEIASFNDDNSVSFGTGAGGLNGGVTGEFGAIQTTGSKGGYGGISMDGNFALMNSGSAHVGLYDDINNEWIWLAYPNSRISLYYNGVSKFSTESYGAYVAGNVRAVSATAGASSYFSDQTFVLVPSDSWGNDNIHHALAVRGGAYDATTSTLTGYCRIKFPPGTTSDNVMMSMMIHGYNYSGTNGTADGGAWCIMVGGYYYNTENWHNTSARIVSGSPPFDRVYFGESTDTSKYILLGSSTTQWDYPKVTLTNFITGHSNQHQWTDGDFTIDFSASTPANWSQDATGGLIYLGGQIRWDGENGSSAASKSAGGRITISTGAASGGSDGDIHFKY
jgi:hypothetical protein